jgi:TPR repeat protein
MVFTGRDLPRDVAEARSLWEQAAALGKLNAMYNLGVSYLGGPEIDRDPAKADA